MAKVILLAYACDRDDVSETWCSYQWTSRLIRQHEATVLAFNRGTRLGAAREQLPGARVFEWAAPAALERVSTFSSMVKPGYLDYYRRARRLMRQLLQSESFDLIHFVEAVMVGAWMRGLGVSHLHVHFATPASTVGLIASRMFPIRLSITVHGPDEFYDAPGYRLPQKIAGATFMCCIGTYARSQLMKLSPYEHWGKFEVSPLGVGPAVFTPRPFRERPDPFEVICVGRLVPAKGQHILVAAVERLVRDGRAVRLRFVGDGPDRSALERDVAARGLAAQVVFEGAVNQDRIRSLYAQADAFALASFAEGIPVVLMEAMAMEIPCVSTFITGIPELIRPGTDGLLVAPSDDVALAGALATLMDDPALRRRLGAAGRQRVAEKYDLHRSTERLAEIFRRRVGGGTS